ncbi:MAG TPA: DUF1800 domain-containing protein [Pyrinomonadaceae bacterium]|nr:DUF1800 domain-containing protein [Pyrinomonadaceae bacterium]
MNRKFSFFLTSRCVFLLLIFFCPAVFAAANDSDPNPDSPVPVLLAETDSARALAVEHGIWNGSLPKTSSRRAFRVGQKSLITLFVTNLDLLEGEGANAFRIYVNHRNGRVYQFPVEELTPISRTVYALRVRLFDAGLRGQPPADGDALVYLVWRGLASNQLKVGLGRTGGAIKIPEPATKFISGAFDESPTEEFVGYRWSGDRKRFQEQATFGPSPEMDARIRRFGLRTWLGEQFEAPYPTVPYPDIPLMPTVPQANCSQNTFPHCYRERYTMQPVQQWFFKEAFYGNAQLRHRTAWALSQIWVTSGESIRQASHMIAFHKVLSKNAFGNYRDLMYDATLNPAMGDYLDMIRSTKNSPNENYAREILQLFSIGLYMLNQDGTLKLDGQGNPIPTYNQETINNFSKLFTGWTYCHNAAVCPQMTLGTLNFKDPMILNPDNHDTGAKTLLSYPNAINQNIPACGNCTDPTTTWIYANDTLQQAMNNIFYHPNVAPFVGKLLIQHLVMSDPSPAYVGRVAAVFNNNGQNVRGDMKAVIRAILLDPEARGNFKTAPRYGKLREPVQLVTNIARMYNPKSFNGEESSDGGLGETMRGMGQNPFYAPTVFNYYPPDYIVPGTTLLAPEFNLLNTGTGIKRINFLYILIFEGVAPNATDSLKGTSIDVGEIVPFAAVDATGNQLLDALNTRMMHGTLTPDLRTLILNAVTTVPASDPVLRAKTAIYLIAASSQYQVQR